MKDKLPALLKTLNSIDNYKDVRPVKMIFATKRKSYDVFGAEYTRVNTYQEGERAVTEGNHKAGEFYETKHFRLLGPFPKSITYSNGKKKGKICFLFPNDDRDWYIAGHSGDHTPPSDWDFMMSCWDSGKIDEYEMKPYTRIPLTLVYLDTD